MSAPKLIPLHEARDRLGISKTTMARLVKEGRVTIHENPLDHRQKLVHESEIEQLQHFTPAPKLRTPVKGE